MLSYNFSRIFALREIRNPYNFLMKNGLSHNFAHRVAKNDIDRISLERLEQLCLLLKCTPHDLMEWTPKKDSPKETVLSVLKRQNKNIRLGDLIKELPIDELEEVQEMIKNRKKKTE